MTEQARPATCEDCKFAIFADYGYSNYTTEGTTFVCAIGAHPDGAFDRWYGEEPKLQYASQCPSFVIGDAIYMDCEEDEVSSLTPEQLEIWEGYR